MEELVIRFAGVVAERILNGQAPNREIEGFDWEVANVLDRIDHFDDSDPTQRYQLTVTANELSTMEREALAMSVDDIEIDT